MTYQIAKPIFEMNEWGIGRYNHEPEFSEEANAFVERILSEYAQLTESAEQEAYMKLFTGLGFYEEIKNLNPDENKYGIFGMENEYYDLIIIFWLFLNKVQKNESKERLQRISILIFNSFTNLASIHGALCGKENDAFQLFFLEVTKFLLGESAIEEVEEAIKIIITFRYKKTGDEKLDNDLQLELARDHRKIIIKMGKLDTYQDEKDRFSFIAYAYKLYKYDYEAPDSLTNEIYDLLSEVNKEKAGKEKEQIEQMILSRRRERYDRLERGRLESERRTSFGNTSWNDSKSHWDEYDEDGFPYSDYE